MRILQGLIDIAGQPSKLARALNKIGYESESWVYYPHNFGFQNDRILWPSGMKKGNRARFDRLIFLLEAIRRFDIWHLHKGYSFLHGGEDLKIARVMNTKIVLHYRGREIRNQIGQRVISDEIKKKLEKQLKYADLVFVHDGELAELLNSMWPNPIVFPNIVEVPNNESHSIINNNSRKVKIVHIPSNPEIKGTKYVHDAIIKLENQVEYFELTNVKHAEALKLISQADLVIDQLLIGTYGNISLEAMAFGKPVICYLRNDLLKYYPVDLPIINANQENLYSVISNLIKNRERLVEVSSQSLLYIDKYHTPTKVAQEAIRYYNTI